jgi:hypothetical protein
MQRLDASEGFTEAAGIPTGDGGEGNQLECGHAPVWRAPTIHAAVLA